MPKLSKGWIPRSKNATPKTMPTIQIESDVDSEGLIDDPQVLSFFNYVPDDSELSCV